MTNRAYTYNIAKEADNKAFKDVCSLLMSKLENAEAKKCLWMLTAHKSKYTKHQAAK